MVKTNAIYDLYNEARKREISNKLILIEKQKEKIDAYAPKVKEVSHILSLYINYSDALNGKIRELPANVLALGTREITYSNTVLRTYYDLKQPAIIMASEIKELNKQKLEYSVYRHIIRSFNEKISKYIVETGKAFEDPFLGILKIKYKENVVGKIDWGQSNRNKQLLLDRGLIPYKKEDAIKAEQEGVPYAGIKWLVPGYQDGMLLIRWTTSPVIKEYLKEDMKFIKYFPARGNYGIVNLLSTHYTKGESVDFTKYETT